MNVFHKVTLQSLKKNKTRTIVTIIGIILSAAMVCAVTTFTSSMQDYALRNAIWNDGSWHGSATNTEYSVYEEIKASDKIEKAIYLQQIGHAYAEGCRNKYKPYIYVVGASEGAEDMLPIHLTSGTYPSSTAEILLPEHLASNGGVKYNLGDTITLALGTRTQDGFAVNPQSAVYRYEDGEEVFFDETLVVKETRTYTVVGFYNRLSTRIETYLSPGYTAITIADKDPKSEYQYDIYFMMNKAKDVYAFMKENVSEGEQNTNVLLYQGTSRYDSFLRVLIGLAAIVIGLIVFGSVSLIYNAFSISVSERTKQFGLLSSIGATKKQLREMVFFEALAVAAIGIPIGIISGIGGIGITLKLIGNKFSFISGNSNVEMRVCASWEAVLIAVVVALVTVLISAWIPSRRATKVSAVEAIRQNADIRATKKPVKTSKLVYRLFGLPGMLAGKHYKRNRKKYRTTVVSLFMSIVLFISASAFTDYLMESVSGGLRTDNYDLWYACTEDRINGMTPEEVLALLKSDKNITNAIFAHDEYVSGGLSEQYRDNSVKGYVLFIPDPEFKELCRKYNVSEREFMNPDAPLAIAVDGNITFDPEGQKYTTTRVLDSDYSEIYCSETSKEYWDYHYVATRTDAAGNSIVTFAAYDHPETYIEVPYEEAFTSYTMKTGKVIYDAPWYIENDSSGNLKLIYPASAYEKVIPENLQSEVKYYRFYMQSNNHAASFTNVKNVLKEKGLPYGELFDYADAVEQERNMVTIIRVFAYGFIVLISLIAAANVFNTISTNINLRRREFAMLKSVGMTQKGFNKMMNFECLLYGSKALLLGLPVSCGITYLIYLAIREGYETAFHLPWSAVGIAVLSVFFVVFATMMYAMSKIKKDNPIDALKNENL